MLKKPPRRHAFHEREEIIDLPNLIEIQVKSYTQFLQAINFPMNVIILDCKRFLTKFPY